MYCLYIDELWVDESCRGTGYGSKLLSETEKIAKGKGCIMVHTDTFSYQAPEFYIKNKFDVFGILDGYPDEIKRYFFKKVL
jgi:ribosomal protein S18 acetylase RimI-like enzyme